MSRKMERKERTTTAMEVLILAAMALITITPIYWGTITLLENINEIAVHPPRVVDFVVTWSRYARILSSGYFKYVLSSALYSVAATAMELEFGYLATYGFEWRNSPMGGILFYPMVIRIPPSTRSSVSLIPNYLLMVKFGLTNHWHTTPLIYTTRNLPLCIWMMISGIQGLPCETEETAKADDCDRSYLMTRLIPLILKPSFAASSLFISTDAWNEYITTSMMVNGDNLKNIQMAIYDYIGFFGQEWGPLCITATVVIIPILLVLTSLGKQLVNRLIAGAVKG